MNIAGAFDNGVSATTQADYCVKQVRDGLNPSVCAERYQMWVERTRGKGQKMQSNWQNGKGSYGGRA